MKETAMWLKKAGVSKALGARAACITHTDIRGSDHEWAVTLADGWVTDEGATVAYAYSMDEIREALEYAVRA